MNTNAIQCRHSRPAREGIGAEMDSDGFEENWCDIPGKVLGDESQGSKIIPLGLA